MLIELGNECWACTPVKRAATKAPTCSASRGFAWATMSRPRSSRSCDSLAPAEAALAAAKEIFETAGLQVAVCGDFDGRIIDRLVRPYYNAALSRLDEGLATADDLDTTLKLGLGYPEGPISLLERTGLEHHYDVTQALFEAYGDPAYAPARRARVAKRRSTSKSKA